MSCCCTKIYLGFCSVDPCNDFNTGLTAQTTGEYILKFSFLNTDYKIKKAFNTGDPIIFSLTGLNENAEVMAQVILPSGEILQFTVEDIVYDCFTLKTQLSYSL